MAQKFLGVGKDIQYLNGTGGDIAVGDVVPIGNFLGVATIAIADGSSGTVRIMGRYQMTAKTSDTWLVGSPLYWDAASERLTITPDQNTPAGIADAPKPLGSETTATVLLNVGIPGILQFGQYLSTVALVGGGGTTANKLTSATAGGKVLDFATENTSSTGADSRGLYWRHYLAGAGASGEAARLFTTVTAAGAVGVHGVHSSLSFSGSGTLTGLGCALRATLHIPDATLGGTACAVQAEIWGDGSSSDGDHASFFRCVFGGDGAAALNDSVYLLDIATNGEGIAVGNMMHVNTTATPSHGLKCLIDGVVYALLMTTTIPS